MNAAYLHFLVADTSGLTETNGKRWRKGTTSQSSLLSTSTDDRVESDSWSSADVASTDTIRAVNLVGRNGHQVNVHLVDIDGNLSNSLCTIGVEEDLLGSAKLSNLLDWLDDTNLVVDSHDRHHHGFGADSVLQLFHADSTVRLDREVCDFTSFILQVATAVKHTLVLGLAGDDVVLLAAALEEAGNTFDAHVVALGGSGGEDDFLWISTDQLGNVGTGSFDGLVGFPTVGMCARMWVSIEAGEERKHGIEYSRVGRSCGLHIEIDGASAFIHDGCLFKNTGSRAHHGIGAHTGGRHDGVLGLDACLCEESLSVCSDRLLDVDRCAF